MPYLPLVIYTRNRSVCRDSEQKLESQRRVVMFDKGKPLPAHYALL